MRDLTITVRTGTRPSDVAVLCVNSPDSVMAELVPVLENELFSPTHARAPGRSVRPLATPIPPPPPSMIECKPSPKRDVRRMKKSVAAAVVAMACSVVAWRARPCVVQFVRVV